MALDNPERVALHQDLVDGLGRQTADRLMAQLPQVDWSQLATKQDLDHRFQLLEQRLSHRFELIDERFTRIDERLGTFEPMLEGKIATQVRGLFFALGGLYLANTALMAGAIGIAVSVAD